MNSASASSRNLLPPCSVLPSHSDFSLLCRSSLLEWHNRPGRNFGAECVKICIWIARSVQSTDWYWDRDVKKNAHVCLNLKRSVLGAMIVPGRRTIDLSWRASLVALFWTLFFLF